MAERLLVKITVDDLAAERLSMSLSVAAAAAAAGLPLSLWLAGESAWLATTDRAPASDAADMMAAILPNAAVKVCARCAQRRGIAAADLLPGVSIAGAAAFVAEAMRPGTRVLIY